MELYYTYVLTYPTGEVFYVGKGQGDRIDEHEKEAAKGIISHKCKVIRSIWASGGKVGKYRLLQTPVESDALLYEWVLINLVYGIDTLTNEKVDNFAQTEPKKPRELPKNITEIPRWTHGRTWVFLSPDGRVHRFTGSLKQFCVEHGLSLTSMHDLTTGKAKSYRGWKAAS